MELVCCMAMISSGSIEKKIGTCFYAFSLRPDSTVSKGEFCFFLDSLCRGFGKIILIESDTFYPKNPNQRLGDKEIELVANAIFKNADQRLSANEFSNYLDTENGPLKRLFTLYPKEFQKAQEVYRDVTAQRLKIIPVIKHLIFHIISALDTK